MFISFVGKVVLAVGAAVVVTAGQAEELAAPPLVTRLVNFQALPDGPRISGVFRMPHAPTSGAGVVILHGSAGMDSRGSMHALDLARVGIATLEIDMWGARGMAMQQFNYTQILKLFFKHHTHTGHIIRDNFKMTNH